MPRSSAVLFLACLFLSSANGQEKRGRYDRIDAHALNAPPTAEVSIPSLVAYLMRPARDEEQKARAIYRWITDRIAYDAKAFLGDRKFGSTAADAVLRSRLTVCDGYANLFEAMGKQAGLRVEKISGYARGFGYTPTEKIATNHAWNAVTLDGKFRLIDATWGAGNTDSERGFVKELDNFYFLPPPDQLIFTHFPEDASKQGLTPRVSRAAFQALPYVRPEIFRLGAGAAQVKATFVDKNSGGLVKSTPPPDQAILLLTAPLARRLKPGNAYPFAIDAPDATKAAFIRGEKDWHFLSQDGSMFTGTLNAVAGRARLAIRFREKGEQFWTILEYEVND